MLRKSFYLWLIIVLALVVLPACAYQVPAAPAAPAQAQSAVQTEDVEAVTAAINEVWEQYASSLNAGDVDRYMALWADEAMQLPPGSPPIVGKEMLRAGLESDLDLFTFDMGITNEEVHVSGDLAVARGTYAATVTPKDGSEEIFIDGKYMTLLKRQPDGSWKIYRDVYNSSVPPPLPEETDEAAEDVEAVTAAVNEVWEQYASSLNAGDVERYMALWADEAIQSPPGAPPIVGKEMLRAGLESDLDLFTFDMAITNEEVHVSGDQAVARGTYAATVTPKDGSEEIFIDGKYMTLLKRQPDGSWKIFRDIYNSNVPPTQE